MKVSVIAEATTLPQPVVETRLQASLLDRACDYLELTKPRIAVMVLVTVAAAFLFAGGTPLNLLHTLVGTALVAAGASALNQLLERRSDARMERTENRPLPAGRLAPLEVLVFGMVLGGVGVSYLILLLPHFTAGIVAALTFLLYVGVYTPLKSRTTHNTLIGAIPGALPPVIGWTAASGQFSLEAGLLFGVLFCWQMPHFMAIAWIYRRQYAQAGLRMIPVVDSEGNRTAQNMMFYCTALVVLSVLPFMLSQVGPLYLAGASVLGLGFLATTLAFHLVRDIPRARLVLRASLLYLPALLLVLLLDRAIFAP